MLVVFFMHKDMKRITARAKFEFPFQQSAVQRKTVDQNRKEERQMVKHETQVE